MKKEFKFFIWCILLIVCSSCSLTKTPVNEYAITPLPNVLIPQEGRFTLTNDVLIINETQCEETSTIIDGFIDRIHQTSGITLKRSDSLSAKAPAIFFHEVEGMKKEAYKLSVTPDNITISASSPNGFYYGVQTIYQLLPPEVYGKTLAKKLDWSVPGVEIDDAPRFAYRGLHLDVCRHFSSVEYIYKYLDMLAMHKVNTFHFHLTEDQGWRIEIKKHPKLTEVGARRARTLTDNYFVNYPFVFDEKEYGPFFYTQEEIKDIVAYAAERYITVIPEIEMPGHALAALAAYPELSCDPTKAYEPTGLWGVFDEVFCPKEETFKFLEDVIDEVVELFPSEYIHVGGDECPKTAWLNCTHCQALIKKLGLKDDTIPSEIDGKKHTKEEKLQSYFITRMEKYINNKGKKIIGWDEILEGGLAPNATVMSWRGVEGGLNAAKAGHDAIMTPSPFAYLDFYQEDPSIAPTTIGGYTTLQKTYSYNPVPDDADELLVRHIIGVQGNVWTEYMQNEDRIDYQAFPRAIALAETGWTTQENKNWDSFCQRMVKAFKRMDARGVKACRNFFDVNINTHVDDNVLKVVLNTYYPDAEIRYTTDGSTPTAESQLYTEPFEWEGKINLMAAAYKDGNKLGRISEKALYANLISGKRFFVTPQMGGNGDTVGENDELGADPSTMGLTNGKRGYTESMTPWVGFWLNNTNNNEVVFTVNLDQPTPISKVVFGSLYNPALRILPAGAATVEISANGDLFIPVTSASFTREYPEKGRKAFTDTLNFESAEAAWVRLILKSGGTLKRGIDFVGEPTKDEFPSILFLDEIEVY